MIKGFPVAFLAIPIIFIILSLLWKKRHKREVLGAGAEMGFVPVDPTEMQVAELPLFESRHNVELAMAGSAGGYEATIFEVRIPKGRSSENFTVIAFILPAINMPMFQAHAKHWTDKVASLFSSSIVSFPNAPAFEESVVVRAPDAEQAREFLTPELQSFLVSSAGDWTIEGYANTLALYVRRRRTSAADLRNFVDTTSSIAQGFLALVPKTLHY